MARAFSEPEKELIRKRLLEEGDRFFSAYGLKKTNIDEIARAAGISKGSFYSFYDSKEALFLEVMEQVEKRVRQQILDVIPLPGSSARARLFSVLKKAFSLIQEIPILQFVTSRDYDLLFRRIPAEKLKDHLMNDRAFIDELYIHCQEAGIPIQVPPEKMAELLYPLVFSILHQNNLGQAGFREGIDPLLELVAAYCLGEVQLQLQSEGSMS